MYIIFSLYICPYTDELKHVQYMWGDIDGYDLMGELNEVICYYVHTVSLFFRTITPRILTQFHIAFAIEFVFFPKT